jgi:hypothetical protein
MHEIDAEKYRDELEVYEVPKVGMVVYWAAVQNDKDNLKLFVFDRDAAAVFDAKTFWNNCKVPSDELKTEAAVLMAVRHFQMSAWEYSTGQDQADDYRTEYEAEADSDDDHAKEMHALLMEGFSDAEDSARSDDEGWYLSDDNSSEGEYEGLTVACPEDREDDDSLISVERLPAEHRSVFHETVSTEQNEVFVDEEVHAILQEGQFKGNELAHAMLEETPPLSIKPTSASAFDAIDEDVPF